MQNIDFLPDQYRRKHMERQSQPWHIVVMGAFAALLVVAILTQRHYRHKAEQELAAVLPQYELAMSQSCQLGEISSELQAATTTAELFTYLRHPWPRTQLLARLLAPLPDEITFEKLQIDRELPASSTPIRRRSFSEAEESELAALSPAARDLKRLRDRFDNMETVVRISGTTGESSAVHRYLSALGDAPLFSEAELDRMESLDRGDLNSRGDSLQFEAALVVRPGYGQAGGPVGPKAIGVEKNRSKQIAEKHDEHTSR